MLDIVLLSFVQGLTEFLPVSSSGHLLLLNLLKISSQGLALDVFLHFGTLLAVLIYFREDIKKIIYSFFTRKNMNLLINLLIGTIPIVFVAFFFFDFIKMVFRSPLWVALNSMFWGILLWLADKYAQQSKNINRIKIREAFMIGCAQALSLIPGTSRSGITMTCARLLGIKRTDSARFSMLLSIPAICGALGYLLLKIGKTSVQLPNFSLAVTGIFLSAVFGWCFIAFFMKWIQKSSFLIFAIYRIALGVCILLYLFI